MRKLIDAFLVCLLLTACSDQSNSPSPSRSESSPTGTQPTLRSVETIADEYLAAYLERYPETGTNYSLPGVRHDRLYDNSLEALKIWQGKEDIWLQELEQLGAPDDVGGREWVTYGVLQETLSASRAIRICRNELWSASAATAWYNMIPPVFEIQPVNSSDLQQQALGRLKALAVYIDTEISNLL